MENSPGGPSKRMIIIFSIIAVLFVAAVTITVLAIFSKPKQEPAAQPSTTVTVTKTPLIRPLLVTTGLTAPVVIASTPDATDKRLFVVEQAGRIKIVDPKKGVETTPFLDISAKVTSGGEMGLLGLTFHPNYKQNGFFYVNYIDKAQNTTIARYHVSTDKNVADPASEKILLTLKQPYPNHNGGDLAFGPDGYLYVALGDGGSGGDPENRAQDKNSLFGKILRLDVNKGDPYGIPESNPFVDQPDVKPEIWAYGLRNPWRMSFDAKIGDLYIGDVGQGTVEEIDRQKADSKGGENYGWRCYEGSKPFNTAGCPEASTLVAPIIQYTHEQDRCSVTGGYVYRGTLNPGLDGKYFYSDYCTGELWYAELKDNTWAITEAAKTPYAISAFGQDSNKELYFTDLKTGSIYQIEDAN